jgi:hypothetical protein
MKKVKTIALVAFLAPVFGFGQVDLERDVIGSAGETSTGIGVELSWTLGELAVNYSENPNLIVSEGFQQADIGSVGLEERDPFGEVKVFPNPVMDELNYTIELPSNEEVTISLVDMNGKVVHTDIANVENALFTGKISMIGLPSGKWILQFVTASGHVKMFNVVKMN